MYEAEDVVKIITIGRQFWSTPDKRGIWAAEILWTEEDENPLFDQLKGQKANSNNVSLEVHAVLEGLRRVEELGLPIQLHCVNDSVVKTIDEYAPNWKANAWRNSSDEQPKDLKEWQEIDDFCQSHDVTWVKRKKEEIDHIKEIQYLWEMLERRENELAMERALSRDPY